MSDPWQFLSLDRQTATEKDVKAAYARLLKQHRPDRDPEGFQKLRQAYEGALASLAGKGSEVPTGQPGTVGPTPAVPRPPSVPPRMPVGAVSSPPSRSSEMQRVDEALAALRAAIASRLRQKVREAVQAFDTAATHARLRAAERTPLLTGAFQKEMKLLAEVCTNDRLLQHAVEGDTSLAHAVVTVWSADGETSRLLDFANAIRRRTGGLADASSSILMMHVAAALGRWQPQQATELANRAFSHLPPDQRDALNKTVDNEVVLGRIFEGFPAADRIFWFSWVNGNQPRCTWRDAGSRQRLDFVMKRRGSKWAGFDVLKQAMSPQAWQELVSAIRMYYG